MKKLIALLLTLSTLFAASCAAVKTGDDGTTETRKAPDEQTTAGDETTAEEQTTVDDVTTETGETIWSDPISIKLTSLEMQILYSDVIEKLPVKASIKKAENVFF